MIQVVGVIMLDSIYPGALKEERQDVVPHRPTLRHLCKPEIRMLVANQMKTSSKLVEKWVMPSWSYGSISRKGSIFPPSNPPETSNNGFVSSNDIDEDKIQPQIQLFSHFPLPPPTILLRCEEFVPIQDLGNKHVISKVDVARQKELLGWEDYKYNLILSVLDLPGNHFDIFSDAHVGKALASTFQSC